VEVWQTYNQRRLSLGEEKKQKKEERTRNVGQWPNMMAALPNTGGTLCSTPQSLTDAQYWNTVQ